MKQPYPKPIREAMQAYRVAREQAFGPDSGAFTDDDLILMGLKELREEYLPRLKKKCEDGKLE